MKILNILFACIACTSAVSGHEIPGWRSSSAISPEERVKYIQGHSDPSPTSGGRALRQHVEGLTPKQAAESLSKAVPPDSNGPVALRSVVGNEADSITPEIEALAAGLRNDPLKIFEFVHNYIDYECYYGSKKGAHLTLLEGSGNDMDQAALLVALLRAAGQEASYGHGPCEFLFSEIKDWWGLSSSPYTHMPNAEFASMLGISNTPTNVARWKKRWAVVETARAGGFFYVSHYTWGGDEVHIIPFTWVEFAHGGTTYKFSPAFKYSSKSNGINLAAATQYNRGNLLSAAGGTPGTPDSIKNLNETNIASQLTLYTSNLIDEIRTNHDSKYVSEILGSRQIEMREFSSWADDVGAYGMYLADDIVDWAGIDAWAEIPTSKMSKFQITAGTYNETTKTFTSTLYNQEVTAPSLAGQKISLTFSGNSAFVRLDEDYFGSATTPFTVTAGSFDLRLKMNHGHYFLEQNGSGNWVHEPGSDNHTDLDQVAIYRKSDDNVYAFPYAFGNAEKHSRNRQQRLDAYRRDPLITDSDWRVISEGLNVMGLTYHSQVWRMNRSAAPLYDAVWTNHQTMGRVCQEGSYFIDFGLNYGIPVQADMNWDIAEDLHSMSMLFTSAMEHGVIEQTQGSGALAASTVRLIQQANANGDTIFRATSTNKNAVFDAVSNYSSDTKNELKALLGTGADKMLVLENGEITIGDWTGGGYAYEGDAVRHMIIGRDFNGGYSVYNDLEFSLLLASMAFQSAPDYTLSASSLFSDASYMSMLADILYSWDPVEMSSGAYVLDKTDLTLGSGEAPLGLSFSRHYHSNLNYDNSGGIGYGWSHNCNIYLRERSAPEALMGAANGYQMAPFVAAVIAAKDLHTNHSTAKEWATCALVVHWAVQRMTYTAIAATIGNRTIQFIEMPDGSYVGPPGLNLTLEKNGTGNFVLSERHGKVITFNGDLQAETVTNPNGATQTFTYNAGKLQNVTDAFTRALTFTWSGDVISSISDGTGRTLSFGYTNGNLTSFTDPESKTWTYQYDAANRMTSLKDPDDRVIAENDFDGVGRVTRQRSMGEPNQQWTYLYTGYVNTEINPLGGESLYFHDSRGRSIGTADALGNRTEVAYDGQDRKTFESTPEGEETHRTFNVDNNVITETDPLELVTNYFYDGEKRLQRINDRRNKDTAFTYTANHQIETVTDPETNVTSFTYHGNGLLNTVTDGDLKTTTTTYDGFGNVATVTSHDATSVTYSNNVRGDVLTQTDAESRTTTFTWNNRRQLLTAKLPNIPGQPDAETVNTYDNSGNIATTTDANGNITSYTYNALGKPVTTTLPALPAGNNVLTTTYDERDWPIGQSNSLTHTTVTEYDAAGRATAVIDPLSRRTESAFDGNGRVTEIKDHLNRTTQFFWNARGEKVRTIDPSPLLYQVEGAYDGNGNQTLIKNRRGKEFTTVFDDANRQVSTTTPTNKTTSTTFYGNNLTHIITEPSTQPTAFAYNGKNLISGKSDPTGAIGYAYDDSGLLTTVTEGATTITREYDGRGRLVKVITADADEIQYGYDANGNLTLLVYPDGKEVHYTYNSRNLLSSVTDWASRTTSYSYDRLGRLTGITRAYNGTSATMVYDDSGQLVEHRESSGGRLISLLRFEYDGVGQLTRKFRAPVIQGGSAHPTVTATYDDDNRLATVNTQSIVHDADGNMTYGPISPESSSTNLNYNTRNQLTNAGGLSYSYDSEGRRRTITDSSGVTRDVIDPNAAMSRLLVRHHPGGSKTFFVYGLGLLYQVDESENTKTHHYDQVGSTILRTDDTGKEIGWAEYSAYGLQVRKSGDMETPFLYNGQSGVQTDANGLLNMRARYYSPYLMRFLNADPIGFSGGMNWFAYADGNPVSKADPFGLDAIFLYGENDSDQSYFRKHAQAQATQFNLENREIVGYTTMLSPHSPSPLIPVYRQTETAHVFPMKDTAEFNAALTSVNNISNITYVGHAWGLGQNVDLSALDRSNVNSDARIYLNGCYTGLDDNNSGSFSAQRYADAFGLPTRGITEGVSFGMPVPHIFTDGYTDFSPGYMRGEGSVFAPDYMWAQPKSNSKK